MRLKKISSALALLARAAAVRTQLFVMKAQRRGKIITVLGANGAGKTTILKTISGVLDPQKGSIEFEGQSIQRHLPQLDWSMLAAADKGGDAVVIGGGLLGLEAAHGLSLRGMKVTVLHLMPTLMERQLDEAAGWLLKSALEARGQTVLTGADTAEILRELGLDPQLQSDFMKAAN